MTKEWIVEPVSPQADGVARRLAIPPLLAQLLLNRGVTDAKATAFLSPQLKDLFPPHHLPGAIQAARIIVDAVQARQRIVLYGDYDVDGTCGVAILWHVLRQAGADVDSYVPHRVTEGYGVNIEAASQLVAAGAKLIVTVDCGIKALEAANVIRGAGARFIVTDHHTHHAELPEAEAIVHPGLTDSPVNPHLCGAGVAFKLAWAISQELCGSERVSAEYRELLQELLPLAALGTIADVVPLTGENRIIARHGLNGLVTTRLPGPRALMEASSLANGRVTGYDVGFKLAPRINAAGRMGHARLAVELFTRADSRRANEIALYLQEHNRARQATERRIAKEAFGIVEQGKLASDARRAIVVAKQGWHSGVIGIVAARLVRRYRRPAVVIALTNGEGQGSARSIDPFDLAAALSDCDQHLLSHGGHAMAAGLRIAADRVPQFTERFVEIANNRLTGYDLMPRLRLDAEVDLDALTLPTVTAIEQLGPFGCGNPPPRLATDWIELAGEPRCVGQARNHLQAAFTCRGVTLKGIGFGLAEAIEDLKNHRRCRVAFEPIINDFNGRRTVEMQMLDLKFPR